MEPNHPPALGPRGQAVDFAAVDANPGLEPGRAHQGLPLGPVRAGAAAVQARHGGVGGLVAEHLVAEGGRPLEDEGGDADLGPIRAAPRERGPQPGARLETEPLRQIRHSPEGAPGSEGLPRAAVDCDRVPARSLPHEGLTYHGSVQDREGTGAAWDAERWVARFREASQNRHREGLRALRCEVFESTVRAVRERGYATQAGRVDLDAGGHYDALHAGTRFHARADELAIPEARLGSFRTQVTVRNADCLEVARQLGSEEAAPLVLNMASRRNPGGGVWHGAGAQEENLFRRSNLLHSLYQFVEYGAEHDVPPDPEGRRYPIPREAGGIYSPPARIFRSSERTGYAFLQEPYEAAFVTVPAIPEPDLEEREGRLWLTPAMAEATRRKIRAILRIGAHHGHADLVLSAFGCGAFRNPPHHMARLFRETLAEPGFEGVFRRVVFAVIDDHNAYRPESPEGNFQPFARELRESGAR